MSFFFKHTNPSSVLGCYIPYRGNLFHSSVEKKYSLKVFNRVKKSKTKSKKRVRVKLCSFCHEFHSENTNLGITSVHSAQWLQCVYTALYTTVVQCNVPALHHTLVLLLLVDTEPSSHASILHCSDGSRIFNSSIEKFSM